LCSIVLSTRLGSPRGKSHDIPKPSEGAHRTLWLALGRWVKLRSVEGAEIAASSGFDFVILDMEHGSITMDSVADLVRAVQVGGSVKASS